ncbi:hypothetical protein PF008_g1732 [Phytophthora fragariae]|uniref:Uncharacterized protein n=1 Tax=Phytophthora fragariae TaxID=53985 RepID=A0A6G0SL78_9STRA|nr:hypothetical protein PF008_g1732 [Phytophthora fragariae]
MASSSAPEHANPLQQRAAAAAQALLTTERKISQREIQSMLEKNEAALKGWNSLHKQQPAKTNSTEHKEWVRRCLIFRQQIGARLEVLASLADKQIAQEDEKAGGQRVSPTAGAAAQRTAMQPNPALFAPTAPQVQHQLSPAVPQQVYAPPQVSTMASSNSMPMTASVPMAPGSTPLSTVSTSASMVMPNMNPSAPTLFPEPPMPTVGFASTTTSMFFPTGQINPMQTSSAFSSTTSMAVSGVTTSTQVYGMSSGVQTFTPNAYMASTSGASNPSAAFMNQQNYMVGGGMMNPQQQFMPMPMPMNMAPSGGGNMFGNNYGMPAVPTSASSSNAGNSSSSNNNFPVDPFMTPIGFGPDASFGSSGFPMAGMSMQQQQMMASMSAGNFGAQGASVMPSNFGYGGMPAGPTSSSQNMMPQVLPNQQFQPTPGGLQPFQRQNQLPQHPPQQIGAGSMNMSPDSALYGDSNVNIFEGLTDDAFFPMQ